MRYEKEKMENFAILQKMKKKFENGMTKLRILPTILGFLKSFFWVKSLSFPYEKFPFIYCVLLLIWFLIILK